MADVSADPWKPSAGADSSFAFCWPLDHYSVSVFKTCS